MMEKVINLFLSFMGNSGKQTDQQIMQEIYQNYCRLMFSAASKYTKNVYDQEDIVQASLEKLLKRVSLLRTMDAKALSSYIFYTVKSVAVDFLRREKKWLDNCISLDENEIDISTGVFSLDEGLITNELVNQLKAVWPKLSEEDRLLLEGRYFWNYSDEELAALFACKPSSIRMKLTRARRNVLNL